MNSGNRSLKKRHSPPSSPSPQGDEASSEQDEASRKRSKLEAEKLNRRRASKRAYARKNRVRQKMMIESEASLQLENERLRSELDAAHAEIRQLRSLMETAQGAALSRSRVFHHPLEQSMNQEVQGIHQGSVRTSTSQAAQLPSAAGTTLGQWHSPVDYRHGLNSHGPQNNIYSQLLRGYGGNAPYPNYEPTPNLGLQVSQESAVSLNFNAGSMGSVHPVPWHHLMEANRDTHESHASLESSQLTASASLPPSGSTRLTPDTNSCGGKQEQVLHQKEDANKSPLESSPMENKIQQVHLPKRPTVAHADTL